MAPGKEARKYITAYEETQAVPQQWEVKVEGRHNRVVFYCLSGTRIDQRGTHEHPAFGWLPRPWELRKRTGAEKYFYFNTSTRESVEHGPRKIHGPPSPPPGSIRVRRDCMGTFVRQEISNVPLYSEYPRVKTLDDGDGTRGKKTGQLYVENAFCGPTSLYRRLAKAEIVTMRRSTHNSIIHYIAAYVNDDPFQASVYMEHYRIPESFIWHALVGLADALAYFQTGQSYVSIPLEKNSRNDWMPLRDTPRSTKPFYTLLADFALMTYELPKNQPRPHGICGTVEFQAPELAFSPYPGDHQMHLQASSYSCKSDVWALVCSHMDRNCWPLRSRKALGHIAKLPSLDITDRGIYSDYLAWTIRWAAERDPSQRPDSWELVVEAKAQHDLCVADPNWRAYVEVNSALPP
ncbi:kinase-like protein [Xylariaceae sp. FL1651]|nr:kinase-like protein [Xylariaceae sp. FL1651]